MPFFINFLSWRHREQDAPDKNKKRQQWRMQVRQELYLTHQIRKSPTGCRAFLLSECSRKISIMLILEKLNVLSYATLLLLTNTLIPTNMVKTDCKKLAINNPTKNFNKIDKLIASVLAKPSIDRKPAKDR